jgi:hydrogenase-4 component F
MTHWLFVFPALMALFALVIPSNRWRPLLLPLGAIGHLLLTGQTIFFSPTPYQGWEGWLLLDPVDLYVLGFQSLLFFICACYAPGYLALRPDRPNRVFCGCLFAVQAAMSLVCLSHHLGLMWVAMEATTLASAPLLYFNHNARSLEATWKYLLIGSVGIALALFGSLFLAYAALQSGLETTLFFDELVRQAPRLSTPWLHAGFILLFIGYGTKMGLAPMHSWKPDAYGEAPGIVGTLLAGGVTSCAFIAIVRVYQIIRASSEAEFAREIMVFMGLLSMAFAAVFMVRQRDFKRMLAYSSVEHMGILVLGVGIGGLATYGALLHLVTNGLTKSVLFLSAGNIHRAYGSKHTDQVSGALTLVPTSGWLFLLGFFAITGAPPFGPFISEFTIIRATFGGGQYLVGGMFLALMAIVFIGMGATVLHVVQGSPRDQRPVSGYRDRFSTVAPILAALIAVLALGLYIPPPVEQLLKAAADHLEFLP